MNALLLLPLVLAGCWCSVAANDCNLTARIQKVNQEGTTGPRVVNAVLDAIECSGVFEDDHRFMRRLAYVETSNGVNDTYTGIWGNTSVFQLKSIGSMVLNSTLLNQIQKKLGIDVHNTILDIEESKEPLVSGVLARFYLDVVTVVNEQPIPPAGDICGQAIFWDSYYKRSAKSVDFILRVNQLEGSDQCSSRSMCASPPLLPEDWMNRDNASGSIVVEAVLDVIKNSDIFPPDHGFMRRIAYVETRDGINLSNITYKNEDHNKIGIWGLTESFLQNMRRRLKRHSSEPEYKNLATKSGQICEEFGVNVTSENLNLRNALVSGIAAYFYTLYQTVVNDVAWPEDLETQASFWALDFRVKDNNATFEEGVMELEGLCPCSNRQDCPSLEWMNRDDASGSAVVEEILHLIQNSGIFPPDHGFMRRIAYVETRDGTNITENTEEDIEHKRVGIWGLTEFMLHNMRHQLKQYSSNKQYQTLTAKSERICEVVGVNVTSKNVNLRNPLASGIAARFFLHYLTVLRNVILPESVSEQASFWASEYNMNGNATTFEDDIMELEGLCPCSTRHGVCLTSLPEDWMNREDASGTSVVEAVLDMLKNSGIFPPDHGFMRRIAYVETRDGTNISENTNVTNEHERVGIWALSEYMINSMRHQLKLHSHETKYANLTEYSELIYRWFNINMTGDEKLNMRIPLVSGIAARFYLHYKTILTNQELPEDLAGQAFFWESQYRIGGDSIIFKEGVMELEGCKVNMDIVFVLDISHSIYIQQLEAVLDFEKKFVKNITIGPDDTRVGTVLFGTHAHKEFNMSAHITKQKLLCAIGDLAKAYTDIRGKNGVQRTNTAEGLQKTRELFESDRRPVLRVAVVLSDGKSTVNTTLEEAEKLRNLSVLVYAIGVGSKVNDTEMKEIAGVPNHYTHLKDFDPKKFDCVRKNYTNAMCVRDFFNITGEEFRHCNGSLKMSKISQMVASVPPNGLTIQVYFTEGRVTLSVFCSEPGDSGNGISFRPTCDNRYINENGSCQCVEVYVPGSLHSPQKSDGRVKRETMITEVHITIEGMERENEFVMDTIDGDDPNDCVGMEMASDCNPEAYKRSTTPSSSFPTELKERSSKKKTVIIAATVSSTGFILICCIVILSSVAGRVLYQRRKQQQQKKTEEEEYKLLDNDYTEM